MLSLAKIIKACPYPHRLKEKAITVSGTLQCFYVSLNGKFFQKLKTRPHDLPRQGVQLTTGGMAY